MFFVLLLAARRLEVNAKHANLFSVVEFLCDRILLLEWKAAGKNADPICWLRSRVSQCSLLFKKTNIIAILEAGLEWRKQAQEPMCACIDGGSRLASALFSACVVETVKAKVQEQMDVGVTTLLKLKPPHGMALFSHHIDKIRGDILLKVNEVKGTFGA